MRNSDMEIAGLNALKSLGKKNIHKSSWKCENEEHLD